MKEPEHSRQIDENASRLPGLSRAQGTEQMPTVWEQGWKQTGTTVDVGKSWSGVRD